MKPIIGPIKSFYFNRYHKGYYQGMKDVFEAAEKIHPGITDEILKNEVEMLVDDILMKGGISDEEKQR